MLSTHTNPDRRRAPVRASLCRIRLELARTEAFPEGSSWNGYEFTAPLTDDGRVDGDAWHDVKEICHVVRFWGDDAEERGMFARDGHGWCFRYPARGPEGKESFFKLDRHRFTPGGYVTITGQDGRPLPFRVVAMTPAITPD